MNVSKIMKITLLVVMTSSMLSAEEVQVKPEDANQTKTSEGMPVWTYPLVPLFVAGGVLHAVIGTAIEVPIDAAKWAGGKIKNAISNNNETDNNKSDNN